VKDAKDPDHSGELEEVHGDVERLSKCWRRLGDLDNNLHQVLDTVLAEAMARDVINEVYCPRFERIDVVALLQNTSSDVERFPVRALQTDLPFMKVDLQLLQYIHRNAVSNACKYGKQGDLVLTLVTLNQEQMELEVQVVNSPGPGHEELLGLGPKAGEAVFEQGLRLHENLRIKDRFISHGDGAWIAQKCAKSMGGSCNINFEAELTTFSFKCPTEPSTPVVALNTVDFEVPPFTYGVAIDDSKIQRKLMTRILGSLVLPRKT
jgi:light-regulated signal transduction histidine kinase (bacteriophytochrome)